MMSEIVKLWIDDIRVPPDDSWYWVKTAKDAIKVIEQCDVRVISFDHDLGSDEDATEVVKALEYRAYQGIGSPPEWFVHSANPVGAKNIIAGMQRAEKFWEDNGKSGRVDGHNQPCYYCGKPCDVYAGNPGMWPLVFCHKDEPGKAKYHHAKCVSRRLDRLKFFESLHGKTND